MKKIIKIEISRCGECPFYRIHSNDYKCVKSGYSHQDPTKLYKICPLIVKPKKGLLKLLNL